MKWSFIILLPAAMSLLWALLILIIKRRPTRAQLILSVMMIFEAFAMFFITIILRGRSHAGFIYDFLFISTSLICVPMYYVGICSLTEPNGASLSQRRSFFVPLVYILGLTIGAFWLGPRRYDSMCFAIQEGMASWIPGDMAWNYMLFWDHYLYPSLMLLSCIILMITAVHKLRIFAKRFNSFYAQGINVPRISTWQLIVYTLVFIVLAFITVYLIDYRPYFYKYWLIGIAILVTIMQYVMGRYIYHLDYDARYLVELIKKQ